MSMERTQHKKGDPDSRALIAGRYFRGETQEDLALAFGTSHTTICNAGKAHRSGSHYQRAIEAADRYYASNPPTSCTKTKKARIGMTAPHSQHGLAAMLNATLDGFMG